MIISTFSSSLPPLLPPPSDHCPVRHNLLHQASTLANLSRDNGCFFGSLFVLTQNVPNLRRHPYNKFLLTPFFCFCLFDSPIALNLGPSSVLPKLFSPEAPPPEWKVTIPESKLAESTERQKGKRDGDWFKVKRESTERQQHLFGTRWRALERNSENRADCRQDWCRMKVTRTKYGHEGYSHHIWS